MINKLNRAQSITDDQSIMELRFSTWTDRVTDLQILTGENTPENVVSARQTRLYMDTAGTTGNILYIKRDDNIADDPTHGWILV